MGSQGELERQAVEGRLQRLGVGVDRGLGFRIQLGLTLHGYAKEAGLDAGGGLHTRLVGIVESPREAGAAVALSPIGPPAKVNVVAEPRIWLRWNVLPIWTGLLLLVAAEFAFPWVVGRDEVVVDGRNAVDGLLTVLFTAGALVFAVSRAAQGSDSLIVKFVPGLFGLATAASTVEGYRFADDLFSMRMHEYGDARFESGMGCEIIGAFLVLVGCLATTWLFWREYRLAREAVASPDLRSRRERVAASWSDSRSGLRIGADIGVLVVVGGVGAVLGWFAAVVAADAMGSGPFHAMRFAGLAMFGVLLGPVTTVTLYRRLRGRR